MPAPTQHQLVDAERLDQAIRDARAGHRAERGAEADDDEQPLAFFLRIDVVGERPELRDDHQVEDADPQEEDDAERHAELREHVEEHQAGGEERGHDVDQPHARELRDQTAVERHDERQHARPGPPTGSSSAPPSPRPGSAPRGPA